MTNNVYKKLNKIQQEIRVPKELYNNFANFHYRNAEDILEAVKPLSEKYGVTILLTDEILPFGIMEYGSDDATVKIPNIYIKATAILVDIETGEKVEVNGYARESHSKKKMDESQMTGSASSYARKYALNGLLALDDNKDADYMNVGNSNKNKQVTGVNQDKTITEKQQKRMFAIANGNYAAVKAIMDRFGYKSSSDILKQDYPAICDEIQAQA